MIQNAQKETRNSRCPQTRKNNGRPPLWVPRVWGPELNSPPPPPPPMASITLRYQCKCYFRELFRGDVMLTPVLEAGLF